ncbi:MAG: hypothetical protein NT118_08555 [Lentisphaerae bacterium]|nr:hypothetical protein [Lentisphaerota bacterium]
MEESKAKEQLFSAACKLWPAAKGSVREYEQKCVKAECRRCASGKGHRVWQLTYYLDGRQKSKHIPRNLIDDVKKALENGRKIESLLVKSGLAYIDELKAK